MNMATARAEVEGAGTSRRLGELISLDRLGCVSPHTSVLL